MIYKIMSKIPRVVQLTPTPQRLSTVENFLFCYPVRSGILFVATMAVTLSVVPLLAVAFSYDYIMASRSFEPMFQHVFHAIVTTLLGPGIVNIALHGLLIIGTVYKIPKLFLPWITITRIWILMNLGLLIPLTVLVLIKTNLWFTGALFFSLAIQICWLLHVFHVVYAYYEQIQEPHETETQKKLLTTKKTPMKV